MTSPAQFIGVGAASGLLTFLLTANSSDDRSLDVDTPPGAPDTSESSESSDLRDHTQQKAAVPTRDVRAKREDYQALRKAAERRDLLEAVLQGLERSRKIREAEERGEHYLPPTVRNCARIVGAGKRDDCPLPFESPETLRFLADCDVLNFDIPWHVYDGSRERGGPPWEELSLTAEQRQELERIDQTFRDRLYPLMKEAYRVTFDRDAPDGMTLSDFHVQAMSTDDTDIAWVYGLAARVRLGEASEAELAELAPRPRYYGTLAVSGDAYERALAEVLTPDQARELRRRDSGWGAQGVSGGGKCPGEDLPEEP